MKSLKLVLVVAIIAAVSLVATAGGSHPAAHSLRWDLVTVDLNSKPVPAVAGGSATSKDQATGDTITITGTGQFTPSRRLATGGGTMVHKKPDGSVVGQGYYFVTRFLSFRFGGGKAPDVADRVTGRTQGSPRDGILRLRVRMIPLVDGKPQAPHTGVLTIYCFFANNKIGLKESDEGFTLDVDTFKFRQTEHGGFTVFHRLR